LCPDREGRLAISNPAAQNPNVAKRQRKSHGPTEHRTPYPEASTRLSGRYRFGRLLQFTGLLILPFGIASELLGKVGLGQSLLIAGGGALLFYVGYVIQHGPGLTD